MKADELGSCGNMSYGLAYPLEELNLLFLGQA